MHQSKRAFKKSTGVLLMLRLLPRPTYETCTHFCLLQGSVFVQILAYYDLNGIDKWAFLGYESLFFVFFFGLAWAALVFVRHEKR